MTRQLDFWDPMLSGEPTPFGISTDRSSPSQSMSVVPNEPCSLSEFSNSFDYLHNYDGERTFYDLNVSETEKSNTSNMDQNHSDNFDSNVETTAELKQSIFSVENIDDDTHPDWINEDVHWGYSNSNNHHMHTPQHHHHQHHHQDTILDISSNHPGSNFFSRNPDDNFGEDPYTFPLSSASINQNPRDLLDKYQNQSSSPRSDSGIDSDSHDEPIKQKPPGRRPGRPPGTKSKKKLPIKIGRLWEFLRDLLHNPHYCPRLIEWEDHSIGTFRFKDSSQVAQLWGKIKKNESMNYEKLSRAMRYYYRTDVLRACVGKRLVYQFGDKAVNWRCATPNFMKSLNKNMCNNNSKITCSTCDMVKTKRFPLKYLY